MRELRRLYRLLLEHFRAKWEPVRVKEMRPNKNLERFHDSIKLGTALDNLISFVNELLEPVHDSANSEPFWLRITFVYKFSTYH